MCRSCSCTKGYLNKAQEYCDELLIQLFLQPLGTNKIIMKHPYAPSKDWHWSRTGGSCLTCLVYPEFLGLNTFFLTVFRFVNF